MYNFGIFYPGLCNIITERLSSHGNTIGIEKVRDFTYLVQYRTHTAGGVNIFDVKFARRRHFADVRAFG